MPNEAVGALSAATGVMGQQLMNPPTVEGWHTGHEWIDGGTLNERINFAVNQLNDLSKPGVQDIVARMTEQSENGSLTPEQFVELSLELAGHVTVDEATHDGLMRYANAAGSLRFETESEANESATHIGRMLQLIVSTREYQFA